MSTKEKTWKYKPIHDPVKSKAFGDAVAKAMVENLNKNVSKEKALTSNKK